MIRLKCLALRAVNPLNNTCPDAVILTRRLQRIAPEVQLALRRYGDALFPGSEGEDIQSGSIYKCIMWQMGECA